MTSTPEVSAPPAAAAGSPTATSPTGVRKVYLPGSRPDLRVPMREVLLSTGDSVVLYDTSGPYTDDSIATDVRRGLPPLRAAWVRERGDVTEYDGRPVQPLDDGARGGRERSNGLNGLDAVFDTEGRRPLRGGDPARPVTQLAYARRGIITAEVEFVARREGVDPELVRSELAAGRAVLPLNVNHPEAESLIIGRRLLVKVNSNLGSSAVTYSIEE